MRSIVKGSADQSVIIRVVDSTDGTPETGVTSATAGLALSYRRDGAALVALTESDLGAADSAHSDGGIIHLSGGYYRVDLPDAAAVTGANGVWVGGTVTGMVVIAAYHPLVDANPYDAVRMGMTALPNAAAEASGGLVTRGTGTGQLSVSGGRASADVVYYGGVAGAFSGGRPEVNASHWGGTAVASANVRANLTQILGTAPTEGGPGRLAGAFTTLLDVASPVLTAASVNQTGDGYGVVNSGTHGNAALKTLIDAVDNFVDTEIADVQARLPAALVSGRMDCSVGAVAANALTASALASDAVAEIQLGLSTLDAAGVRAAVGLASANLDTQLSAIDDYLDTEVAAVKAKTDLIPAAPAAVGDVPTVAQIWTTALTQSYAADGAAFTGAQALFMVWSMLAEKSISGTTMTCRQLDGSTTSMTFTLTLDGSGNPTAITRAS